VCCSDSVKCIYPPVVIQKCSTEFLINFVFKYIRICGGLLPVSSTFIEVQWGLKWRHFRCSLLQLLFTKEGVLQLARTIASWWVKRDGSSDVRFVVLCQPDFNISCSDFLHFWVKVRVRGNTAAKPHVCLHDVDRNFTSDGYKSLSWSSYM
jgi:hypothetical protein